MIYVKGRVAETEEIKTESGRGGGEVFHALVTSPDGRNDED